MESPEDIEKALGRLMPSAISERGQRALEGTIDGLAAGGTSVPAESSPRSGWWTAAVAIPTAAAAALTVALVMSKGGPARSEVAVKIPVDAPAQLLTADISAPKKQRISDERPGDVPMKDVNGVRGVFPLENGTVTLISKGSGDVFHITSPSGKEIFFGSLESANFPSEWKEQAEALRNAKRRALQRASEDGPATDE
jgi:hypothetical protein